MVKWLVKSKYILSRMKHFHLMVYYLFAWTNGLHKKRIKYDPYFIKRLGASIKLRLFTQATQSLANPGQICVVINKNGIFGGYFFLPVNTKWYNFTFFCIKLNSSSVIKCVFLDIDQSTIVRLPNHFQAGNYCLVYHGAVIVSLELQAGIILFTYFALFFRSASAVFIFPDRSTTSGRWTTSGRRIAPCKGIRIPESRNFLLVESGIQH